MAVSQPNDSASARSNPCVEILAWRLGSSQTIFIFYCIYVLFGGCNWPLNLSPATRGSGNGLKTQPLGIKCAMPMVLRFDGPSVVVYPADHIPAHVHVFGGGNEAVFNLNCPAGPVALRENYGFARRAIARIRKALDNAVPMLCREWSRIYGQA